MKTKILVFAACVLLPSLAVAQTKVQNSGFRENVVRDDTLLKQGRWELALQSAGMWTKDSGESSDGTVSASGSSFYMNPSAAFGYMAIDALQVRVNAGYLKIATSNNGVALQDFNGFLGTLNAYYHIGLKLGTALYVGAGGGYLTGSTTRPGLAEGSSFSNATSGFAGQGALGLLVQPGPSLTLRGGVRFDGLFANETSSDPALMPDVSSTNLKLMGEFAVGLRF